MKRSIVRCYLSAATGGAGLLALVYGDLWGLLILALSAAWQFDRPLETIYVPGVEDDRATPTVPYPPVFYDWRREHQRLDRRVATGLSNTAIEIQVYDEATIGSHRWLPVELTEEDAALLAASLLQRVGYVKEAEGDDRYAQLADETLRRLGRLI